MVARQTAHIARTLRRVIRMVVFFSIVPALLFATFPPPKRVTVAAVVEAPERFHHDVVHIEGEVAATKERAGRRYYLLCEGDAACVFVVTTNALPDEGIRCAVVGRVRIDSVRQLPFIEEETRRGARIRGKAAAILLQPTTLILFALIVLTATALAIVLASSRRPSVTHPAVADAPFILTHATTAFKSRIAHEEPVRNVSEEEDALRRAHFERIHAGAVLVANEGQEDEHVYHLSYETSVGREHADILLDDSSVSSPQAIVRFQGGGFIVENRSTINPTRVNGDLAHGEHALVDGDVLVMGFATLTFHENRFG